MQETKTNQNKGTSIALDTFVDRKLILYSPIIPQDYAVIKDTTLTVLLEQGGGELKKGWAVALLTNPVSTVPLVEILRRYSGVYPHGN